MSRSDFQARWATIFETAADAIILIGQDSRILRFNEVAQEVFGYTNEQIVGKHLDVLIPDKSVAKHRQYVEDFAETHEVTRLMYGRQEIAGKRSDGTTFPAEATISKIDTNQGMVFTVILRDVSEHKKIADAIRQQNAELNAFAHTVAHDLKTPLGSVIGYASLLQEDQNINEDQNIFINGILETSLRMNTIIDELLLLATLRQSDVEFSPINMQAVVDHVVSRLKRMISDSNANIIIPDEWVLARGYAGWIEEVWTNYISNAIKYGGDPPMIELGSTLQNDGTVRFWVRDNGNGISEQTQTELFTEFTRFDKIRAQGHGLGLSIVRRIMEKLGGSVGVESQVGQGSIFYFTLPHASDD